MERPLALRLHDMISAIERIVDVVGDMTLEQVEFRSR
jgi:uncharacterized protein with HEPN domain